MRKNDSGTTMSTWHIAHLNTNPEWGGGEHQVLKLIEGLHKRDIRTTLYAHPSGELLRRATEMDLPAVPFRRFLPIHSLLGSIREKGTNLLHVHDSRATSIGGKIGKRLGIPVLLSRRVASPIKRNFRSRRKYSQSRLRAVIAISETVRSVFLETGYPAERVHVVPSGLDIDELSGIEVNADIRKMYGSAHVVVGIGKLSSKKNWQMMIRTAAAMKTDGKLDIHWLLLGEGSERGNLIELAKELGVGDCVHFLGFRNDATQVLKTADLLFFPSLREGASVTVREAMILGTPVVAVDNPGTAESLAGNGWLISGDDLTGAAACVREALVNTEKQNTVIQAARESAVDRFSIDHTIEGTLNVYRQTLSNVS